MTKSDEAKIVEAASNLFTIFRIGFQDGLLGPGDKNYPGSGWNVADGGYGRNPLGEAWRQGYLMGELVDDLKTTRRRRR